jgi:hypothetical protein
MEILGVAERCGRSCGGKPWKTSWWQIKGDIVRQSMEDLMVTVLRRPPGSGAWKDSWCQSMEDLGVYQSMVGLVVAVHRRPPVGRQWKTSKGKSMEDLAQAEHGIPPRK